jgi:GT2 family glycosyltransferase/peptidoglycan/xylan/chitin deacetylase (PgdA/CDA1 family)
VCELTLEEKDESAKCLTCTLVVATWQRPELLRSTLASLLEQSYPEFEIVVVCDGEDPQTAAVVAEFRAHSGIRWFFHESNRGLAAARNTGAREALGDLVLFLDDDVIASPGLVEAHVMHHKTAGSHRRLVVCGLITEDPERQFASSIDRRLHEMREFIVAGSTAELQLSGPESVGDDIERGLWCGLNCSIRREAFLRVGGFNEHFRKSGEEMEMGQRLHLQGFEFVFEAEARLLHKNTKSWSAYYRGSWRDRGELDVYRVLDLGEKSAQTQKLGSIHQGYFLDRMAMRLNWISASPLLSACEWLETAANRTEWHFLFGLWARVAREAEYWTHVKGAGCTLAKLKAVVKPRKCALMLHSLCEPQTLGEAGYYLSPKRFHLLMRWFLSAGYRTATTSEWLKDGLSRNQVLLTFDDGYDDLYDHLLPVAIQHRLTAVIFLVAERVGGSNLFDQASGLRARNLLNWPQIREMQRHGFEFGSHTLTHPHLPDLSEGELRREVRDSKRRLEDALGVEVTTFAYPYGGVDRRVRAAVAEAGYKLAFSTLPGPNWWNDPLCQRRAEVNEHTSLLDFAFQLRTGYGFTQSISERLRSLERNLPTGTLRRTAAALRSFGHSVRHGSGRQPAGSR